MSKTPNDSVPLGHFDPDVVAQLYPQECRAFGALTIVWGQLERQLLELFRRLSGMNAVQAETAFFSSTNHKARRDMIKNLINRTVENADCKEWMLKALDEVKKAADQRNSLMHSEYFGHLTDSSKTFAVQPTPGGKNATVVRHKILNQVLRCFEAIREAYFHLEFAYAATHGPETLQDALQLYEPALRERRERKDAH